MFHKAIKLEYKEGTTLELTFQDGKVKRYDMSALFGKYPQLEALKDRNLFTSGRLLGPYGIVWNDDLDIEALAEKLPQVMEYVDRRLEAIDCPSRTRLQIGVAVEEVFVNIASYAYAPGTGRATVRVEISEAPAAAVITFTDRGVP